MCSSDFVFFSLNRSYSCSSCYALNFFSSLDVLCDSSPFQSLHFDWFHAGPTSVSAAENFQSVIAEASYRSEEPRVGEEGCDGVVAAPFMK